MAMSFPVFGGSPIIQMRGSPIIDKPGWGPPDMAEQIQKSLASLYGLYTGAEQQQTNKYYDRDTRDAMINRLDSQGQRAAALGQPGQIYGGSGTDTLRGGFPTVGQGGMGPDNPAMAPTPASTAAGGRPAAAPTPQEVRAYYRDSAVRRGIDPDVMERVVLSEGGWDNVVRQSDYRNAQGVREQSYGPLQLFMGGGLGNEALARGIDPRDPNQWKQVADFGLEKAAMVGWDTVERAPKGRASARAKASTTAATPASRSRLPVSRPRLRPAARARRRCNRRTMVPLDRSPRSSSGHTFSRPIPMRRLPRITVDPQKNQDVGGAKNSQHMHGTALDLNVKGMSTEQKAALVDDALARGAKGIGWYNDGSLHIDFREGQAAAWGPNRSRTSLGQTEPWFRERAEKLLATGGVSTGPCRDRPERERGPGRGGLPGPAWSHTGTRQDSGCTTWPPGGGSGSSSPASADGQSTSRRGSGRPSRRSAGHCSGHSTCSAP